VKIDYLGIVVLGFLPLFIRSFLYWAAFRIRSISIKLLNCIVIAGAPYFLLIIPLRLPQQLSFLLALGVAIFLTTRYTEAELFPDAILIPVAVELASWLLLDHVLMPILT
jgi:hypothetical protein